MFQLFISATFDGFSEKNDSKYLDGFQIGRRATKRALMFYSFLEKLPVFQIIIDRKFFEFNKKVSLPARSSYNIFRPTSMCLIYFSFIATTTKCGNSFVSDFESFT